MTADSSKGFFLSALLHGSVVALMFIVAYVAKKPEIPQVFELVAGEGDNYGATKAPAYGTEGGAKMTVPIQPLPQPKAEPVIEAAPVTPAPPPTPALPQPKQEQPKVTPKTTEPPPPNFAKDIKRTVTRATDKAKREVKKQQDAEAKKAAAEAKKAAEEQKRMTKEEFDRENKSTPTKVAKNTPSAKAPKIDTEGIKKGVIGGSTENKVGGAGGKALTATEGTLAQRYMEMLKQRLLEESESRSSALPDGLRAEAEFHLLADGRIVRARILKKSGNEAFDAAVLAAIAAIRMPERPKGIDELQQFPFETTPKNRR
jgi:colicin import membrane protein